MIRRVRTAPARPTVVLIGIVTAVALAYGVLIQPYVSLWLWWLLIGGGR